MACTVAAWFPSGLGTLTLKLYARGSVSATVNGAGTAAAEGDVPGYYAFPVSPSTYGLLDGQVLLPGGVPFASGSVYVYDDGGTYRLGEDVTPRNVWSFSGRTLTVQTAAVTGQTASGRARAPLAVYRGDTYSASVSTGYDLDETPPAAAWLTVKSRTDVPDTAAVLQVSLVGLQRLNGAAPSGQTATLAVTDAANGQVTLTLPAATTALLPQTAGLRYDLQLKFADGTVATPVEGAFSVLDDVTRAT